MSVITVAVAPATIAENAVGLITYTFTRSAPFTTPLADPLTVNYSVAGTAAPLGEDYTGVPFDIAQRTVTFAANSATATLVLDPVADLIGELTESVIIRVATGPNYTAGTPSSATASITNAGGVTIPVVSITTQVASTTSDSPAPLVYRISRTGNTGAPLTVFYRLDGGAQNGVDYRATPNYVVIPAGASFIDLALYPMSDSPNANSGNFVEIQIISSLYQTDSHLPLEGFINAPNFNKLLIDPSGPVQLSANKNTINWDLFVTVANVDIPVFFRTGEPLGYKMFAKLKPIAAATIGGVNQILMMEEDYRWLDVWTMTSDWVLNSSIGSVRAFPDSPESTALQAQFGVVFYPDPSDTGFPACPAAPVAPPLD